MRRRVYSPVQITADVSSAGLNYVGPILRTSKNRIQSSALDTMKVIASIGGKTAVGTITVTDKQLDQVQIIRTTAFTNASYMKKGDGGERCRRYRGAGALIGL